MPAEPKPRANEQSQSTTAIRARSAATEPQHCGDRSAGLFDVEGLIVWIRRRYPVSPGAHVQARTGVAAATVENWLQRRSQPSIAHFTMLISVYGPSLVRSCLRSAPGWVDRAVKTERALEIEAEIARLRQEQESLGGSLAAA